MSNGNEQTSEPCEREPKDCEACNGTGSVDTGGTTPWGAWIETECPYCNGSGKLTENAANPAPEKNL